MTSHKRYLPLLALSVLLIGCSGDTTTNTPDPQDSQPDIDVTSYILDAEPSDAVDVIAARADAKDDDEIVIVGRIGGSANPWVEQRAAFSIVDASLPACSDKEECDCPTPWDYCCETDKLPTSVALIKFVDSDGQLLAASANKLFKIEELQTVVIRGKAQRDESGNLNVLADGLFVRN